MRQLYVSHVSQVKNKSKNKRRECTLTHNILKCKITDEGYTFWDKIERSIVVYLQLLIDNSIQFTSLHKIDTSVWRPKFKVLTDMDIIFTHNNTVNIQCDSENIYIEPRQAFLALPGQTIRIMENQEHSPTGVWVLHFRTDNYQLLPLHNLNDLMKKDSNLLKDGFFNIKVHVSIKNDLIYNSLQLISEELKYKKFGYNRKLNLCLLDILHELHRSSMEDVLYGGLLHSNITNNLYCKKVIDFLHSNFMNKITAQDIEQSINLSYDYLNAIFKEFTGVTIMNCLDDIRIARARELIATTSLYLYEIAGMVGINDSHYFSKRFREKEGMSPSLYKKMIQS